MLFFFPFFPFSHCNKFILPVTTVEAITGDSRVKQTLVTSPSDTDLDVIVTSKR